MNSQRETYSSFEEFWENANRRLTDFNEKQARMIWQAATEQGVGEPVGHIGKNSEPQLLHDLPPETKLYTHSPKPTGGGVPDGYVLVPLDVVDREEILDKAMDYHFDWCGYASRSDISEAARAVAYAARDIATQQPPEQE